MWTFTWNDIVLAIGIATTWVLVMAVRHTAAAALRGAVASHMVGFAGVWVNSGQLAMLFGTSVYPVLRDLVDDGLLDRREGPTSADRLEVRGGRQVVYYRWRSSK